MGYKNNDQFQLARDMFRWQRFMNMAMNRRVPTRPSISSPAEEWRYTLKNHPLSWISWLCNLFVPQGRHDGKPCHFTRCMMLAVQHIATTFGFRHAVNIVWCKWRRYIMTEYTFICSHKNWQSCEETLFASITCIMEINSFHLKLFVSLVHSLLSLRMALLTHGATGELVEDLALTCMFVGTKFANPVFKTVRTSDYCLYYQVQHLNLPRSAHTLPYVLLNCWLSVRI